MKTIEFQSQINPDHTLTVPQSVADQIEEKQSVKVIILIPETDDEKNWSQLTQQQFLMGYADTDAIYDKISTR